MTLFPISRKLLQDSVFPVFQVDLPELVDIKQTLLDIGLDNAENINYLRAIKRVIGMIDKDLIN